MIHANIRERLIQGSQSLPDEILQEVVDFMEFVSQNRGRAHRGTPQVEEEAWQNDFRSISVWSDDPLDVKVSSWKIESF